MNYYERLEILIDQGTPLFLHLIAQCFSQDIRPAQFALEQVNSLFPIAFMLFTCCPRLHRSQCLRLFTV